MMTRVLAVGLALALASSVAEAARGTVTLDRVGTTTPMQKPTDKLSGQPATRRYRPTTGGPTYSIRVPVGAAVRDGSLSFIAPAARTQRSDVYDLRKGIFLVTPTQAWSDVTDFKGQLVAIDPR